MTQRISLNIMLSYPVHWDKYRTMRDFIQNFYDEIGADQWKSRFHYHYDPDQCRLLMEVDSKGFSYDWLLHIGASTKTKDGALHAGYFGEGFKMASLCAHRDHRWGVIMASRNWKLMVCTDTCMIDGKSVQTLAYLIDDIQDEGRSWLQLDQISKSDFEIFLTAMDSFFFPENKMLGELIWKSESAAVYRRSKCEINKDLPVTYEFGRKGVVFVGFQMLGTNPFDLVFCLHDYEKDDRERRSLYEYEVNEVVLKIATRISPLEAIILLSEMKRYWYTYPRTRTKIEVKGWSPVINALIRRVWSSVEATETFRKLYPNLLCAARTYSMYEKNRRTQARAWMKRSAVQYRLVKDSFGLLGYESLEEACARNGGFVESNRLPNQKEKQCYQILEKFARQVFGDFFLFGDEWPVLNIITNERAVYQGMASLQPLKEKNVNCRGITIRRELRNVYLLAAIFQKEAFSEVLATYLHELCHIFGGDASEKFSHAVTLAMEIVLDHQNEVRMAETEWNRLFS